MAGFLFRLETADGGSAEPATLSSVVVPDWKPGHEIHPGRRTLRVIAVRNEDADQPPVLVVEVSLIRFSSCFQAATTQGGAERWSSPCDPELRHSAGRPRSAPSCEGTRSRATRSGERQGDVRRRARRR